MTRFRRRATALLAAALLALAGCGTSQGPGSPADGSYAFLASSSAGRASDGGRPEVAALTIAGEELTLVLPEGRSTLRLTGTAPTSVLCPPHGAGAPRRVSGRIEIGTVELAVPALFGPCPETRPTRVTMIDLDSYDPGGGPFRYSRFVEFCLTTDPDC